MTETKAVVDPNLFLTDTKAFLDHLRDIGRDRLSALGNLMPLLVAIKPDGSVLALGLGIDNNGSKSKILRAASKFMRSHGVVRYGSIMEGWMAPPKPGETEHNATRPSQREDRKEAVVVSVSDVEGLRAMATYEIHRDSDGKPSIQDKPDFETLGEDEEASCDGAFMDLLDPPDFEGQDPGITFRELLAD